MIVYYVINQAIKKKLFKLKPQQHTTLIPFKGLSIYQRKTHHLAATAISSHGLGPRFCSQSSMLRARSFSYSVSIDTSPVGFIFTPCCSILSGIDAVVFGYWYLCEMPGAMCDYWRFFVGLPLLCHLPNLPEFLERKRSANGEQYKGQSVLEEL